MTFFKATELEQLGLNLQAIANLSQLPEDILSKLEDCCSDIDKYSQLLIIGHGGNRMWQAFGESEKEPLNPIDNFSLNHVTAYLDKQSGVESYQAIYPGGQFFGLQQLGKILGWHHDSPFRVGINSQWGSWFAYRVVMLTKSKYQPTAVQRTESPCLQCNQRPCVNACPANALSENDFALSDCLSYRESANSSCRDKCLARMACPVGKQHQYSIEQINYHYSQSMNIIESKVID
ncbi:hypothetical protein [Aliikangiella sp. IMCC44359]|uniref:hypothetical protein n=1 Tax=Aliikangiella sp. IMCC44359 TaxID=3459125 RepID=UPI00403AC695